MDQNLFILAMLSNVILRFFTLAYQFLGFVMESRFVGTYFDTR